jgi:choline kinase
MNISRAIIVGAGRGSRMGDETVNSPKALLDVAGKPVLDWAVEALNAAGIDDIIFVGGYRMRMFQERYPQFTFVRNTVWERTNILRSLMFAEPHMDRPFLFSYADLVYTSEVVRSALSSPGPMAAVVERDWRPHYEGRQDHSTGAAEKVIVEDGRITQIGKLVPDDRSDGEFIGMLTFDTDAIRLLRQVYAEAPRRGPYHGARSLSQAYVVDAVQEMINRGLSVNPVMIEGGWIEIDTPLDLERARAWKNGSS